MVIVAAPKEFVIARVPDEEVDSCLAQVVALDAVITPFAVQPVIPFLAVKEVVSIRHGTEIRPKLYLPTCQFVSRPDRAHAALPREEIGAIDVGIVVEVSRGPLISTVAK